ncbi:hypothetical protein RHMOL_Rhmol01G0194700 [Rhododendron molle]|uniref:Uncharacterized protein n=1 Tax=Rhododendron molle TaxID=49168 RepID=A0ACC0Q340_RHOML|nr:hypothetical protein RHMOL_Rhmol01G0194700 [Rhododendron molle]
MLVLCVLPFAIASVKLTGHCRGPKGQGPDHVKAEAIGIREIRSSTVLASATAYYDGNSLFSSITDSF